MTQGMLDRPPIPTIDRTVVIDWQLSSYFAWGILGINFVLNWSLQQRDLMLTTIPINEQTIDLNPLEWTAIAPAIAASRSLQTSLEPFRGKPVRLDLPVLHALGNGLAAQGWSPGAPPIEGTPNLGMAVFESAKITVALRERAKQYALIVVPSTWNRSVLESAGIGPVDVVFEGIDPSAFHPAPRAGLFPGRFTVFSGGKLEYRKGQDLVLRAFRIFAQRHADALLVTTWNSPWPQLAATLNSDALEPIGFDAGGRLNITGWAVANGIPAGQFLALGPLPNSAMPRIIREMDVALFANRCEGATNLVATECLACGIPVILSRNTGHLDVADPDRCYVLAEQAPIAGDEHAGWGESDIEEMVETLEAVYADRAGAAARAARGAEFMRDRTWAEYTRLRAAAIAPYVGSRPSG